MSSRVSVATPDALGGQWVPELVLIQTAVSIPADLEIGLQTIRALFDSGAGDAAQLSTQCLIGLTGFIHEALHFVQFTSRLQGIEYYSATNDLARASIHCFKQLVNCARSEGLTIGLPLAGFANLSHQEGPIAEIMAAWSSKYGIIETELAVGLRADSLWAKPDLLQALNLAGGRHFFPELSLAPDGAGSSADGQWLLTPQRVLETEAAFGTLQLLATCFPDRQAEVVNGLHDDSSDDTRLCVHLMERGLAALIPLLADFSMQCTWRNVARGWDMQQCSVVWRFWNGLSACETYAGITLDEVYSRRNEILTHVEKELAVPAIQDDLAYWHKMITKGAAGGFDLEPSLRRLLVHNLRCRIEHPSWSTAPALWIDQILGTLCVPLVLFSHQGLSRNSDVLEIGIGEPLLSNDERLELFLRGSWRWAGRELAVRRRKLRCPWCDVLFKWPSGCNGRCPFSNFLSEEFGFDPSTAEFVEMEDEDGRN